MNNDNKKQPQFYKLKKNIGIRHMQQNTTVFMVTENNDGAISAKNMTSELDNTNYSFLNFADADVFQKITVEISESMPKYNVGDFVTLKHMSDVYQVMRASETFMFDKIARKCFEYDLMLIGTGGKMLRNVCEARIDRTTESYWFINSKGIVCVEHRIGTHPAADKWRKASGNAFATKEEAQTYRNTVLPDSF